MKVLQSYDTELLDPALLIAWRVIHARGEETRFLQKTAKPLEHARAHGICPAATPTRVWMQEMRGGALALACLVSGMSGWIYSVLMT
jgi:hypothetical protein